MLVSNQKKQVGIPDEIVVKKFPPNWLRSKKTFGWLLLLPTLIVLAVTSVYPIIYAVYLSLQKWNFGQTDSPQAFVGLGNFTELLSDQRYWSSMWVTIEFLIFTLPLEFLVGLGMALLLNRTIRGRGFIRAVLLLPIMVSPVVIVLIWKMMYQVPFGPLNAILKGLGLIQNDILWLSSPQIAMLAIVIATVWQWYPFSFLVLSAGLGLVPNDQYEAAAIDGANRLQVFRNIVWPYLVPSTLVILLIRMMDGFKTFAIVYSLTNGGPGNSTDLVSYHIYNVGFGGLNVGYGAAMALVLMVVMVAISLALIGLSRRFRTTS
ncbi:MAG TPA: sugar ABC transporter permease [Chloroflexia bacterium]|nr:sugar ABC transporter permease [Chloroflexia bacterium]